MIKYLVVFLILITNANAMSKSIKNPPGEKPGKYLYGELIGNNPSQVSENSGMAYSKKYNRIYMINDSGGGNYFYITDMSGKLIDKVEIVGAKNNDYEGLSLAPCGEDQCLFIGDIGDNSEDNKSHKIYMIKELESFNKKALVETVIDFSYQDKVTPNAESIAVHPVSGDIFIATKNYSGKPTIIYKIARDLFSGKSKASAIAKYVGEVDYVKLNGNKKEYTHTTDMAFSPSGGKFALLIDQSKTIWEIELDLSKVESFQSSTLKPKIIAIDYLGQEESMFYLSEDQIVYTTEGDKSPILKIKK